MNLSTRAANMLPLRPEMQRCPVTLSAGVVQVYVAKLDDTLQVAVKVLPGGSDVTDTQLRAFAREVDVLRCACKPW